MKLHRLCLASLALASLAAWAPAANSAIIATSRGIGADAEVRDHQPSTNFGASTELATRIVDNFPAGHPTDGNDRFSAMYMKFDIQGLVLPPLTKASIRLTYRNNNLGANRVQDTSTPNPDFRTGLAFYGLDRDHPGNAWDEATITYLTAPGMGNTPGGDFNNGTKDYDFVDPDLLPGPNGPLRAPLVPLGIGLFPVVAPQNRLPIGGELLMSSTQLRDFIQAAITAGKPTVTIVAGIVHDGKIPINDWKNFNYLFNPKEMLTLNTDAGYDADTTNPNNPLGAPLGGASNAEDANGFSPFSPQIILVPEPSSLALLAFGAAAAAVIRRRR